VASNHKQRKENKTREWHSNQKRKERKQRKGKVESQRVPRREKQKRRRRRRRRGRRREELEASWYRDRERARRKKERRRRRGGEGEQRKKKKNPKKQTCQNTPKFTETAETHRNTSKFYPRWNGGLSRTGTRFSIRSGRNGTEYTTMVITIISISLACSYLVNLYIHWQMPIEFVSVENEEKNTVIFFIYYF
jgi:hypothetical protein